MIFYYANGELGNQLFQYKFIGKVAKPNEIVISSGLDDLKKFYCINNKIINIPKKPILLRFLMKIIYNLLVSMGKLKIITIIGPSKKSYVLNNKEFIKDSSEIIFKKGFFSSFKVIKSSTYMADDIKDSFENNFHASIKQNYIDVAQKYLKPYNENIKIFIHIRLGDYDKYTVFGNDLKLPIDYYHKAIEKIHSYRSDNLIYIICSNRPDEVIKLLEMLPNKVVSRNKSIVDMAIMNLCDGGILSASTFSYFGAFFQKSKNTNLIIAPEFWYGFKVGFEYPDNSFPNFASPINVYNK